MKTKGLVKFSKEKLIEIILSQKQQIQELKDYLTKIMNDGPLWN